MIEFIRSTDPSVLNRLLEGLTGQDSRTNLEILETLDQELHQLVEMETRQTGQFELLLKQTEQVRQQLGQTRNKLTAYRWLKSWLNEKPEAANKFTPSTALLAGSTLNNSNLLPLMLESNNNTVSSMSGHTKSQATTTNNGSGKSGRTKLTTRTIKKIGTKKLPTEWRLMLAYSEWIDFHARSASGNREEVKLLNGNGKKIRPFIPIKAKYNPKLLCGCELSTIAFGFLVTDGNSKRLEDKDPMAGRYCLKHLPVAVEVKYEGGRTEKSGDGKW